MRYRYLLLAALILNTIAIAIVGAMLAGVW